MTKQSKKPKGNEYVVALNVRGRARQFGAKTLGNLMTNGKQNLIIILAAVALFVIFTIINSSFADGLNILTMVQELAPYAILGLGVTFVIATGGIDLSIGTVCIASAVIAGKFYTDGMPLWIACIIMVVVGGLFGLLNGFLVAKLKLPPFIATLGTMMFSRGISAIIAKNPNIFYPTGSTFQKVFSNLNDFPIGLVWVLGLLLICLYLMYKCKIGRYILSIGSNEEATRLSGIRVDNYKVIAYLISGLLAGFAAIFWAAANPTVTSAGGNGMELDAIAGVYIGGTSSTGGIASVFGSLIGAILLVVLRNGLNIALATFQVPVDSTYITYAVTGIIVVLAVFMDILKTKASNKVKVNDSAVKCKARYREVTEELRVKKDYILSNRKLTQEERTAHCAAIDAQLAELKKVFIDEYAKCKVADVEALKELKESKRLAKEAEKATRAAEREERKRAKDEEQKARKQSKK